MQLRTKCTPTSGVTAKTSHMIRYIRFCPHLTTSCKLFLNTPSSFSDGNPIATILGLISGGGGGEGRREGGGREGGRENDHMTIRLLRP